MREPARIFCNTMDTLGDFTLTGTKTLAKQVQMLGFHTYSSFYAYTNLF